MIMNQVSPTGQWDKMSLLLMDVYKYKVRLNVFYFTLV